MPASIFFSGMSVVIIPTSFSSISLSMIRLLDDPSNLIPSLFPIILLLLISQLSALLRKIPALPDPDPVTMRPVMVTPSTVTVITSPAFPPSITVLTLPFPSRVIGMPTAIFSVYEPAQTLMVSPELAASIAPWMVG